MFQSETHNQVISLVFNSSIVTVTEIMTANNDKFNQQLKITADVLQDVSIDGHEMIVIDFVDVGSDTPAFKINNLIDVKLLLQLNLLKKEMMIMIFSMEVKAHYQS